MKAQKVQFMERIDQAAILLTFSRRQNFRLDLRRELNDFKTWCY